MKQGRERELKRICSWQPSPCVICWRRSYRFSHESYKRVPPLNHAHSKRRPSRSSTGRTLESISLLNRSPGRGLDECRHTNPQLLSAAAFDGPDFDVNPVNRAKII